jgi:hypothetical protein
LMAIMALLTGVYHLGRRRAVELLSDIVGVRVSLGALSIPASAINGDLTSDGEYVYWTDLGGGLFRWKQGGSSAEQLARPRRRARAQRGPVVGAVSRAVGRSAGKLLQICTLVVAPRSISRPQRPK